MRGRLLSAKGSSTVRASRMVTLRPTHRLTCIHARPAPTVTAVPPSSATVTAKSSSVLNTPEVRVEK